MAVVAEVADGAPPPDGTTVIALHSRRLERVRIVQRIQHLIPAGTLLAAGTQGLSGGAEGLERVLAFLEIGTSALLIGTMVRSMRARRASHGEHAGMVDWFDVFAASVIFTEVLEKWVTHHHLARPMILLGLVTLGIGLSHGWIRKRAERRRALRVGEEGVAIGGRKFARQFRARWDELATIEIEEHEARIVRQDGRRCRIDLADLHNGEEVRAALLAARERIPPPPPAAALPA
jgi:hypothetical protein